MKEVAATFADCPAPAPGPRLCAELLRQNATLLLDVGGTIRWCSRGARQLLARPVRGVIGRPIAEFVPALPLNQDTPGYNGAYVAFTFGEDHLRPCRVLEGSASAFDADVAVSPVRLGDARGFVVAVHPVPILCPPESTCGPSPLRLRSTATLY